MSDHALTLCVRRKAWRASQWSRSARTPTQGCTFRLVQAILGLPCQVRDGVRMTDFAQSEHGAMGITQSMYTISIVPHPFLQLLADHICADGRTHNLSQAMSPVLIGNMYMYATL